MAKSTGSRMNTAQMRDWFTEWCSTNGYKLVDFEWDGARKRYPATCPEGHDCGLTPFQTKARGSRCEVCSYRGRGLLRKASAEARDRFLAWAADNGYTLTDFEWKGVDTAYPAACPNGHACQPRANDVLNQGKGGCASCTGKVWDVFYVVVNPESDVVKFGITSGDPRPRLADHRRNGFTRTVRVLTGMPEGEAADLEREVMTLLRIAGVQPVQGREYFPGPALNMIMYVVSGWFVDACVH